MAAKETKNVLDLDRLVEEFTLWQEVLSYPCNALPSTYATVNSRGGGGEQ